MRRVQISRSAPSRSLIRRSASPWRAELDDRMPEVEAGMARAVPWAEARARLRARRA